MIGIGSHSPNYHSRIEQELFEFLSDQLPDFVVLYDNSDECPKGHMEIQQYLNCLFTFQSASVYVNDKGEITVRFNWFVRASKRERITAVLNTFIETHQSDPKEDQNEEVS